MKWRKWFLVLFFAILLTACKPQTYHVTGTVISVTRSTEYKMVEISTNSITGMDGSDVSLRYSSVELWFPANAENLSGTKVGDPITLECLTTSGGFIDVRTCDVLPTEK